MGTLFAFFAGLAFGIGLIVAGMVNPAKVLAFLDLAGNWDPSLALVMLGAIAPALLAFGIARLRSLSLLGLPMQLPAAKHIDLPLLAGSALFGIGWGIAGICPGPALVLVGSGVGKAWAFAAGMLGGMILFAVIERRRGGKKGPAG